MYGTSFTGPVGNRVLKEIFEGNPSGMYEYACRYDPGKGGPHVLGLQFRELVGNKNRTSWWSGAKMWLEEQFGDHLDQTSANRSQEIKTDATSNSFTMPTAEKVLKDIFDGDVAKMYAYADDYKPKEGGPYNLGSKFREIIKTRNRTSWWQGAKSWIEKNFPEYF